MRRIVSLWFIIIWLMAAPAAAQTETGTQPPAAPAPEQKKETAPPHTSTSWKTLPKDTAKDFVAFPKRPSTWVILGIGAGAALATQPVDNYVESHIVGNEAADKSQRRYVWCGGGDGKRLDGCGHTRTQSL